MRLEAPLIAALMLSSLTILQTSAAFAITDITAPTISITAPAANSTVSGAVSWTVSASDNVGVNSVYFFIDGKTYAVTYSAPYFTSVATTALSNGQHTWLAIAYDAAGNEARAQIIVATSNPDTTGPTTTILNPLTGTTVSGTMDYTVRASDINGATKVEFYVDNALVGTDTTADFDANTNSMTRYVVQWNTASVPNSSHTLMAKGYDKYNNIGTRSITITTSNTSPSADTIPPVVTVPASMTIEATGPSGAIATYTATATDNVDGSITPTCSPSSGSTFSIGTTIVSCSAIDTHGNTASASFSINVQDTTAPSAPIISSPATGTLTSDSSPTFIGSAESGAIVRLYDGSATSPFVATLVSSTGSWSATPSTALSSSTHSITAKAVDAAGNMSPASSAISITVDTLAPAAPSISSPLSGSTTNDNTPTFTGSAEASSTVRLYDGSSTTPFVTTTTSSTGSWSATPTLTMTEAVHSITAKATDKTGNTSPASAVISFTIKLTTVDSIPPVVTVPASMTIEATGPSGAIATYTATATDNVDGSITPTCAPSSGSIFPISTTTVNCSATDAIGNIGVASFTVTVRDTTAPIVSVTSPTTGQTIGGTSAVSINASDKVGLSYVELYIDGKYYGTDSVSPYAFSVDTTSLTNGQHQFSARAMDKHNNAASSPVVSPTVQNSVSRITPPNVSITSPLSGSTLRGTVPITTSVSDADGIAKLEISVDGRLVATLVPASTTAATTFTYYWDSTSVSNGSHTITATAYDIQNASSSDSISIKVQNKGTGKFATKA